jgi:ABC-2 type transport system ATP-binding protein
MPSELAIETRELRKRYGGTAGVNGLTLDVPRGSICGFLGRNGAGKTTTLKMLMGMTRPSGGDARVLGLPIADPGEGVRIRQRTGYVSEDKLFAASITVGELLRFTRAHSSSRCRRRRAGCRRASGAGWRSSSRWRGERNCCCSTSRPRGSTPR